jgi:hypothetical protein
VSAARRHGWRLGAWGVVALVGAALAGCAGTSQDVSRTLPGGIFNSQAYHFSVTYPAGWVANSTGCAASGSCSVLAGTATVGAGHIVAVPLQVTITRADQAAATTPVVSSFAVTVLDMRDPNVAKAAGALKSETSLHAVTLAGQPGFATNPVEQPLPGTSGTPGASNTRATITHTAYFLVHGGFEYQIGVDSVSNDGSRAALQAMLQSFTLSA